MQSNLRSQVPEKPTNSAPPLAPFGANDLLDYWVDAWQRSILLLDVLRQRGNNFFEHNARKAPNVLSFDAELVLDGRTLERPVNYGLVRIIPPAGTVDRPEQAPVHRVRSARRPRPRHRRHEARQRDRRSARSRPPLLLRRLFAGAGARPDDRGRLRGRGAVRRGGRRAPPGRRGQALPDRQLPGRLADHDDERDPSGPVGPIMLAGSPLSYWAGVHGKNPMRYLGGLLGGTWLTSLAGDLGNGIFDGANLVANFESLHPDNTYWKKIYDVYSKIDTEAAAVSRIREMVGQPGAAQCRGNAVHRRSAVRRQQAVLRRAAQLRRAARRPAQHQIADHRVLLHGATTSRRRSRHWTGFSISTTMRTRSSPPARRSSIACTRASAISASSSRARWRRRSTRNSPVRWT